MKPPIVGVSDELIIHHAARHPCPVESNSYVAGCPCGTTAAIVCSCCGWPVFVAVERGTWCPHAAELEDLGCLELAA